jgi:hypothetical protein
LLKVIVMGPRLLLLGVECGQPMHWPPLKVRRFVLTEPLAPFQDPTLWKNVERPVVSYT